MRPIKTGLKTGLRIGLRTGLKTLGVVIVLSLMGLVALTVIAMTYDYNQLKPIVAQAVKDITGRDLKIVGDVDLAVLFNPMPMPVLSVTDVRFSNAAWGRDRPMVSLKRLDAKIDLLALFNGQIKVDTIMVDGLSIFLETDAKGRDNWKFPLFDTSADLKNANAISAASVGGVPLTPVIRNVRLRNVRVSFLNDATGRAFRFFVPSVKLSADRFGAPIFVAADVSYKGVPIKVRGKFGSLEQLTGAGDATFPVRLNMTLPGFSAKISGKVKNLLGGMSIAARLDGKVTKITTLEKILGTDLPDVQPLKGRITLSGSGTRYVFSDIDLQAGDSTLTGKGRIDFSALRPRVSAKLSSRFLDFDTLMSERRRAVRIDQKVKAGSKVFSTEPLPWALLRKADADVKIDVKRIKAAGLSMTRVRARAKLSAGRLDVENVRFDLGGGFVSGTLRLNGTVAVPSVKLRAKIVKVDVGRVLKMRGFGNILFLPISGRVQLASAGTNVHRLMSDVNGFIQAAARDGRIDSQVFSGLTTGAVSILPWAARKNAGTITCMIADWQIKAGIATARSVLMDTPGFRVAVRGNANLGREKLHLSILPRAKTVSLASFAVPVRLKGSFSAPYVDVSPEGLVVGTVKNVANAPANIVSDLLGAVGMEGSKSASCIKALSGRKTRHKGLKTKNASAPQSRGFNPVKDLGNTLNKAFKGLFGP